jgi:hypothetical protein
VLAYVQKITRSHDMNGVEDIDDALVAVLDMRGCQSGKSGIDNTQSRVGHLPQCHEKSPKHTLKTLCGQAHVSVHQSTLNLDKLYATGL